MTFSIIIPVLFSDTLTNTIQAIENQTAYDRIREVLVVGKQEWIDLSSSKFRYIQVDDHPNVTHNRNIGIRESKGDWICFTDSDCIPEQSWIAKFIPYIENGFKAIGGAVDIPGSMTYWGRCHHFHGFENQACGIAHTTILRYAATLNFCIHRKTIVSLGGFNETLIVGGEDRDLSLRLQQNNIPIAFAPEAAVIHTHPRRDFKSAWNHSYQFGQNTANVRIIHKCNIPFFWRLAANLLRIPILGEITVFFRALGLSTLRLFRRTQNQKILRYYPGVFLLDIALGIGMAQLFRKKWLTKV